ncbi:hypothetical protein BHM03_00034784 [Ensete ventricosum]|nr:hypothetical protein BHM03_00034784 [Ensete ventricosum]
MSFYSECCRSFVPGNLTAFMVDHVVVPFHHACRPYGEACPGPVGPRLIANPTNLGLVGINHSREQGKETPRCGGRWGRREDEERRTAVVGHAKIPRWCGSSLQPHVWFKETKNKQLPEKATTNLAAAVKEEGKWASIHSLAIIPTVDGGAVVFAAVNGDGDGDGDGHPDSLNEKECSGISDTFSLSLMQEEEKSATKLSSRRPFNGANNKDRLQVFLWRCHPKGKPKSSFCHQPELNETLRWRCHPKEKSNSSFCHEVYLEEKKTIQWSKQG